MRLPTFIAALAVGICGCVSLGAIMLSDSVQAATPTARQYFEELLRKNAFDHYDDEYVCFPDKDGGEFAVIAKGKDIERLMAASHRAGARRRPSLGNYLVVQTFYKGVSNGLLLYKKVHKDSDEAWSIEYKSPIHGKNVYLINWTTGRYRFLVYALKVSSTMPAAENDGKCQLIHPWVPIPSAT